MTKLFYVNMDGQRQYCDSLLKLRKISLCNLVMAEDPTMRHNIYAEDGKIVEKVFMVLLNDSVYLCYQHFANDKIRCYRSYYSGNDCDTIWTLSGTDNKDIDWIEIITMRDKQLFGMRKKPVIESNLSFEEFVKKLYDINSQLITWEECRL